MVNLHEARKFVADEITCRIAPVRMLMPFYIGLLWSSCQSRLGWRKVKEAR